MSRYNYYESIERRIEKLERELARKDELFGLFKKKDKGSTSGKVGTSKPGLKAQIARDVMANRPAQYRGTVTLGKPIASVGEVSDRDALSRIIEGTGADGIIYNNVYDNGFNNNQVIHSFVKPELVDINKPAVVKYYGPTMGKSFAAKSNPNLIDLDT